MKKFLFISFVLGVLTALAQYTTPRFGITPGDDNTGRVLTYNFVGTAEATGPDTIKIAPNAYETLVRPSGTIKDSLKINVTNITRCRVGDRLTCVFQNSSGSGHKIVFIGSNFQFSSSGATITLVTLKRATITFIFDGVTWVEVSRVVQS